MKRMRILGLALVAVFAVVAITAGAASAKPTWKACVKTEKNEAKEYTGSFSDKLCSKGEANGKYEIVAGIGKGKKFKGKGKTAILHNVIPGKGDIKVECASFKDQALSRAFRRQQSGIRIQEVQIARLSLQNRRWQKGNHHDPRARWFAGLHGQSPHVRR